MEWTQFALFFSGMAGLFFWGRSESRADNRQMLSMMQGINAQISAIQAEVKDFHGRLCAIEERNKGK